jgi:hypothetical protein
MESALWPKSDIFYYVGLTKFYTCNVTEQKCEIKKHNKRRMEKERKKKGATFK